MWQEREVLLAQSKAHIFIGRSKLLRCILRGVLVQPCVVAGSASEVLSDIAEQCVEHCAVLGGLGNRDVPPTP